MNTAALTPSAADPVRPGAVFPLRPLAQDEAFLGAFSVIRGNPRATLGLVFLAAVLNFVISLLLLTVMPSDTYLRMLTDPGAFENQEMTLAALADGGVVVLMLLTTFLGTVAMSMTLGLLAIPALRSAYGLPTSLRQTLRLRCGRMGWLVLHVTVLIVGLSTVGTLAVLALVLLLLVAPLPGLILALPALLLGLCWATAAVMFGPLLVVVERRHAFSAIARSFALNRGRWWRHIGTVALVYLMLGVVMLVTYTPAGILGALSGFFAQDTEGPLVLALLGLSQFYEMALNTLLMTFVGVLIALLYLNARFRREALDVMLLDTTAIPTDLPGSPEHQAART